MTYGNFKQGFYEVRNKEKYIGNNKPYYRSSWESRVMNYLDLCSNVIKWSSEKIIIPYKLPKELDGTGKIRRYFVDFYCEVKNNDGIIKKYLIEVKPKSQSIPPSTPKRITKSYKHKVMTFMINQFKWESAKKYCESKGYEWMVLTEEQIFNIK
jgi:hypothetical protein